MTRRFGPQPQPVFPWPAIIAAVLFVTACAIVTWIGAR